MNDGLGKKAERKIKEWLDKPQEDKSCDRVPDQVSGQWGSKNICDFVYYTYPNQYYIESKATWADRFDFSMITDFQYESLMKKSKIRGCYGTVVVLFASYARAFILNIKHIDELKNSGKKSININKIDSWGIPFTEIQTIPSRKELLDYCGEFIVQE